MPFNRTEIHKIYRFKYLDIKHEFPYIVFKKNQFGNVNTKTGAEKYRFMDTSVAVNSGRVTDDCRLLQLGAIYLFT